MLTLQQVHLTKGPHLPYITLNLNPAIHLLDNLTLNPQESKRFLRMKKKLQMMKKVQSQRNLRMPKSNNLNVLQTYLEQLQQPTY
jgi:hypothetical protein